MITMDGKNAILYYKQVRILSPKNLVVFCKQLLLTDEGSADREEAHRRFTGNFEADQTIEIAESTLHA